jgi:hypothetical protein
MEIKTQQHTVSTICSDALFPSSPHRQPTYSIVKARNDLPRAHHKSKGVSPLRAVEGVPIIQGAGVVHLHACNPWQ